MGRRDHLPGRGGEGERDMDVLKELLDTDIQGLPLEKILGAVVVGLVGAWLWS